MSWPAFLFLWLAVLVATLIWLGWRRSLMVLALPFVSIELYHGNIHLLLAAAVGEGLARWMATGTPPAGLTPFGLARFG